MKTRPLPELLSHWNEIYIRAEEFGEYPTLDDIAEAMASKFPQVLAKFANVLNVLAERERQQQQQLQAKATQRPRPKP